MFRAAVIGLGQIGLTYDLDPNRRTVSSHSLAYEMHPEIVMDAGIDTRSEREVTLRSIAPHAKYFSSLRSMAAEGPYDFISICTPPSGRLELMKEAVSLLSPQIVFIEKPLEQGLEQAIEFVNFSKDLPCRIIPNLSRRWNPFIQTVQQRIIEGRYGRVINIHVRYTRGIFNTGSHLFDLIKWFAGNIETVQVVNRVVTSSDLEGEPSYSFHFRFEEGGSGYAEACNDHLYYLFDIDIYLEHGKIEIYDSGNTIRYYIVDSHALFSGHKGLHLTEEYNGCLKVSCIQNAVDHLVHISKGTKVPICSLEDAIYPFFIAEALERSYQSGTRESVVITL